MKEIQISERNEELVICIPKDPNWFIILFTGIWLASFLGLLIVIIYGSLTNPGKLGGEIILFIGFFIFISLLVLKTFLWNLRGKEKITLDNHYLKIEQKGTILSWPSMYELDYINDFEEALEVKLPWIIKFYGFAGGTIQFKYWEQIRYFGQSVKKEEIEGIVSLLNEKLKEIIN